MHTFVELKQNTFSKFTGFYFTFFYVFFSIFSLIKKLYFLESKNFHKTSTALKWGFKLEF